jgi:hypothetical protein
MGEAGLAKQHTTLYMLILQAQSIRGHTHNQPSALHWIHHAAST